MKLPIRNVFVTRYRVLDHIVKDVVRHRAESCELLKRSRRLVNERHQGENSGIRGLGELSADGHFHVVFFSLCKVPGLEIESKLRRFFALLRLL